MLSVQQQSIQNLPNEIAGLFVTHANMEVINFDQAIGLPNLPL